MNKNINYFSFSRRYNYCQLFLPKKTSYAPILFSSEVKLHPKSYVILGKMSGRLKQRSATNTADSSILSVNEKILKECHSVYTDADNGKCFYQKNELLF